MLTRFLPKVTRRSEFFWEKRVRVRGDGVLKGRESPAQGRAQRRPGSRFQATVSVLKGRENRTPRTQMSVSPAPFRLRLFGFGATRQGGDHWFTGSPVRRCAPPWAGLSGPCGAFPEIARMSPAVSHQPRGGDGTPEADSVPRSQFSTRPVPLRRTATTSTTYSRLRTRLRLKATPRREKAGTKLEAPNGH